MWVWVWVWVVPCWAWMVGKTLSKRVRDFLWYSAWASKSFREKKQQKKVHWWEKKSETQLRTWRQSKYNFRPSLCSLDDSAAVNFPTGTGEATPNTHTVFVRWWAHRYKVAGIVAFLWGETVHVCSQLILWRKVQQLLKFTREFHETVINMQCVLARIWLCHMYHNTGVKIWYIAIHCDTEFVVFSVPLWASVIIRFLLFPKTSW